MTAFLTGLWLILSLLTLGATVNNPLNEPDVPFPPAEPTAENMANICLQGPGRPRYPPSFFPPSGASHFRRRGNAINRLESWFISCCSGFQDRNRQLCCATKAWKQALSKFCAEEHATMTAAFECCDLKGEARWACFNEELPNPDYSPTPGYSAPEAPREMGFVYNAQGC